jgi:hypothetical protein
MSQLKVYVHKDHRQSYLPRGTEALVGATRHGEQGNWYLVAHTAVQAVELAERVGIAFVDSPRHLSVLAHLHNDAQRLRDAGFLATPGEVIVHRSHSHSRVVTFTGSGWATIGYFEYDAKSREIVFIPEEG